MIAIAAWFQLGAIRSGAYDPVRDDRMSLEEAAQTPTRLNCIIAGSAIAACASAVYLADWQTTPKCMKMALLHDGRFRD